MERVESELASRLRRFVRATEEEHCEFCSKTIDSGTHLVERATRKFFALVPNVLLLLGVSVLPPCADALHDFDLSDDSPGGLFASQLISPSCSAARRPRVPAMYPGRPARSSLFASDTGATDRG
jgi:hypothetical protein